MNLLKNEYKLQESVFLEFSFKISLLHIQFFISKYKNEITAACEKLICCCYDKFFDECIYQIDDLNNFILLYRFSLNLCNYDENSWIFCSLCYEFVKHNNIFKFFSKNLINITTYQNYSSVLKNLTIVKKYFIAKCHFLDIILKL